jgi:cellulose biosynthesis protein BcsQ
MTVREHTKVDENIVIGEAAHIEAASPGGPRYNCNMTESERSSSSNAIWLCRNCSKLIDSDVEKYPVPLLKKWKNSVENFKNQNSFKNEQTSRIISIVNPAGGVGKSTAAAFLSLAISTVGSGTVLCINSLYNHAAYQLGASEDEIKAMQRIDCLLEVDKSNLQRIGITPLLDTITYEQFEKYYNDAKWTSGDMNARETINNLNYDICVCDCGRGYEKEIHRHILLTASDVIIPVGMGVESYIGAMDVAKSIKGNANLKQVWLLFANGLKSNTKYFNLIYEKWQTTLKDINQILDVPCKSFSVIVPNNYQMEAFRRPKPLFYWSKTKNVSSAYISIANELIE